MANDTLKLTDREVLEYARDSLEEHLPLQAEGYQCSTTDLLDVLLGVAVSRDTIESVCADWIDTVNPETIRGYLNAQLTVEGLPELERRLNAALAAEIPDRVWRQERDIAIDLHGVHPRLALARLRQHWHRGWAGLAAKIQGPFRRRQARQFEGGRRVLVAQGDPRRRWPGLPDRR